MHFCTVTTLLLTTYQQENMIFEIKTHFVLFIISFNFLHGNQNSCAKDNVADCHSSDPDICLPARVELSEHHHVYAVDNLEVSKVSFSSCFMPDLMSSVPGFWSDMRLVSRPDLWLWLGDAMYHDGNDINGKVNYKM